MGMLFLRIEEIVVIIFVFVCSFCFVLLVIMLVCLLLRVPTPDVALDPRLQPRRADNDSPAATIIIQQ